MNWRETDPKEIAYQNGVKEGVARAESRVAELEAQLAAERAKLGGIRAECMKFYQQSGPIQHIVAMIDRFIPQPPRPDVSKVYSTGWDGCDTDEGK